MVSCIGFAAGPGTQRKITEAALAARVSRYFPWQFGVDYDAIGHGSPQDLFDEQLDVRDMLRAQDDTEWVIVSTGMFTSFLFEPDFGVVDLAANTVNALGSWDTEVTVTTPEDIGVLTAEIIQTRPRIANQVVYVAGGYDFLPRTRRHRREGQGSARDPQRMDRRVPAGGTSWSS